MEIINTGVAEDPRTADQKQKDWTHTELIGSGTFDWKETVIPNYPKRNQNGSFECGGFSLAKALGINNIEDMGEFLNLNPNFIYRLRSNKGDGMYMQDMFEIGKKYGSPQDPTLSCDKLSQSELDNLPAYNDSLFNAALRFRSKNYVFIDKNNIDDIAIALKNGYSPILLVACPLSEWLETPKIDPTATVFNLRHFVVAIGATIRDGVKSIAVDDSFPWSGCPEGTKYLTEEFIKTRVEQIGYCLDLPDNKITKPKYHFTVPITYGMQNIDVIAMQKILVYEGFMPEPKEYGYFLNITANALKKWQVKHGILDFANETNLKNIRFGRQCIDLANKLYWNI